MPLGKSPPSKQCRSRRRERVAMWRMGEARLMRGFEGRKGDSPRLVSRGGDG